MAYDPRTVANYFIEAALSSDDPLSPMKLQKLVFYAHGWHLAIKENSPLITEPVQAWRFGPVIPSLYHACKDYEDSPITAPIKFKRIQYNAEKHAIEDVPQTVPESDVDTRNLLEKIWKTYGRYTPIQLSNMTHEQGSPWSQVVKGVGSASFPKGITIPDSVIAEYFRGLAAKR